ncbi:MAG: hypothetical protein J6K19_04835 [Prevotella sp.]|nr:hypothetical protein [Prevotella sp.]
MKRFISIFLLACSFNVNAQTDEFRKQYDDFKRKAQKEYVDFRNEANKQYAEFMQQAWQQYKTLPAIPKPKDEDVKPVVMPEEDKDKPIDNKPVVIEDVITPPTPKPQPVPIAPIRKQPTPEEKYVAFNFYGTECEVRFNDSEKFKLSGCDGETLAKAWERLSDKEYNNTIRDCLELRIRLHLCDWAYLNVLDIMTKTCLGNTDEATLLMAYIYCQSGYKMRLGVADNHIYLLYSSDHNIYDTSYFNIDGEKYYPFKCDAKQMNICRASFPKERVMSLFITNVQQLAYDKTQDRTLQSERYPELKVDVSVNKNLINFYNSYPTSEINGNFMTRWAMYANTLIDKDIKSRLYPTLKSKIGGMSKKEAAERLLNFVQTAFVYEYDDKVWGGDRAFFAEETLFYPYCDCEDRSILFSRLVRDLLGLDVILVYYPGHLATAVCFDGNVNGDYIMLGNKKFIVCDPTYIGAPVGMTMPDMDNKTANVILLDKTSL